MPRWQLAHTGEDGPRLRDVAERQILRHRSVVDLRRKTVEGEQRAQLGAEPDTIGSRPVRERLDAEAVAGDEQSLAGRIPDREGEHAAQVLHDVVAVLLVAVDDRLGIGARPELVATVLQGITHRVVVVDLAIEDDLDRAVLVSDGLVTAPDVDDREPSHSEAHTGCDVGAPVIRPPVCDRVAHRLHRGGADIARERPAGKARYAAHRGAAGAVVDAGARRSRAGRIARCMTGKLRVRKR